MDIWMSESGIKRFDQKLGNALIGIETCGWFHKPRPSSSDSNRSFGLLSKRRVGIDVHEELVPYLDAVILAFMICECERRVSATASRGPAVPTSPTSPEITVGGGY